ncbi:hypothetical protein [Caudoviricetes sp.]|nr:hypothetical protein [Caudoviricetes sp.]
MDVFLRNTAFLPPKLGALLTCTGKIKHSLPKFQETPRKLDFCSNSQGRKSPNHSRLRSMSLRQSVMSPLAIKLEAKTGWKADFAR